MIGNPLWLLLFVFIALLAWRWPRLHLLSPLRLIAVCLLVFALADVRSRWGEDGMDLWVLIDRSSSAESGMASLLPEWKTLIEAERGLADRIYYLDFATEALLSDGLERERDVVDGSSTRLASAIRYALAKIDADRPARILLLSDGQSTEPLEGVSEALLRAEVALDYRLLLSPGDTDYQLVDFRLPAGTEEGAGFLIEATVVGKQDATIPWELMRGDEVVGTGSVVVNGGRGEIRLLDRLQGVGIARYTLRLLPENDAHPENNVAESWIRSGLVDRVLLLSAFSDDPLAGVLRAGGVRVDLVTAVEDLAPENLSGVSAVVLHNVPSWRLDTAFLESLKFFVEGQGGGLLMVGGQGSFAAGGWFETAIDPLLPVSMEMRQDQRKLAVVLAIVLDRSGSMAASAGGGFSKMDLANAGAARAVQLLGDMDQISVHAVDTEPHEILPLLQVKGNRNRIQNVVRRITSMGGGIYIYPGLEAGWRELQKAEVGQRHMVLFADAADAENPGNYLELLKEFEADGTTLSVIGLGRRSDPDASLLEELAAKGGGRMFFVDEAGNLPAVFAQETVTIARSAFLKQPVPFSATVGWRELAAEPIAWLPSVDGYNLSYLRPGATAVAISGDEYAAPLVASWQRGAGRTAAVTFPLGGDFSELTRGWDQYGDFVRTLLRWLKGEPFPPSLGIKTRVVGNELAVQFFAEEGFLTDYAAGTPKLVVSSGADGVARALSWERMSPGLFEARTPVADGEWLRGAVQLGEYTMPFGPLGSVAHAEWLALPERLDELRDLSLRSGGRELIDFSDVWSAPISKRGSGTTLVLCLGAFISFLIDAFLTRLGISLRSFLGGARRRGTENGTMLN